MYDSNVNFNKNNNNDTLNSKEIHIESSRKINETDSDKLLLE